MRERRITNAIVIHHSASASDTTLEEIRSWHTSSVENGGRGWEDIGYHFVVEGDGRVRIGRPENMEGTQVANFNGRSIGICLCGNFNYKIPENKQLTPLVDLLVSLVKKYDLKYWNIYGHKDIKFLFIFNTTSTACPGDYLALKLSGIRREVGKRLMQC